MKIVQINATCGVGSTGKICVGIGQLLNEKKIENYILYSCKSNGYQVGIQCSYNKYLKCQALKSRILGNYGFNYDKRNANLFSFYPPFAFDNYIKAFREFSIKNGVREYS